MGLRGEKVRLVPVDRALHFDNALRWMNDPEVTRYLSLSTGVTPGMEEEWFQKVQKRETDYAWAIHDERGRHIGFTGLHNIDWGQRRATSGIVSRQPGQPAGIREGGLQARGRLPQAHLGRGAVARHCPVRDPR